MEDYLPKIILQGCQRATKLGSFVRGTKREFWLHMKIWDSVYKYKRRINKDKKNWKYTLLRIEEILNHSFNLK